MKVLAINGSPHEFGCTNAAINIAANELIKQNIEVEIIYIGTEPIRGCIGCGGCGRSEDKKCVFDDIVNVCIEKSKTADGLIIGTPVHYSGIAGSMKSFLDRFFTAGKNWQYKPGAAVVSLRRSGGVETFHGLNNYFNLAGMVTVPSNYWNVVHGTKPEEVLKDEEGIQIMQTLGKNMAWLLKVIDNSKGEIVLPHIEPKIKTNFIR